MSLLLITNPPTVLLNDTEWTDLVLRSNANMLGHGLSIPIFTLTNWDATTTIPQIAQGSIIEVGGSFYQADVDTALTPEGGIIDGTVHIKLVPAGGGASVVPTLTNDAIPAWDAVKAGWYTSDDKFLPFEMTKAAAVYTVKSEFIDQNKTIKISPSGEVSAATVSAVSINTGTLVVTGKIEFKYNLVNSSISATDIITYLSTVLTADNEQLFINGNISQFLILSVRRIGVAQYSLFTVNSGTVNFTNSATLYNVQLGSNYEPYL